MHSATLTLTMVIFALMTTTLTATAKDKVKNEAQVVVYTERNGYQGIRIEIKTTVTDKRDKEISSFRKPAVKEFLELIRKDPNILSAIKEAAEISGDIETILRTNFAPNEPMTLDYKSAVLARIAHAMNKALFTKKPTTTIDRMLSTLKVGDARHIDKAKLKEALDRKATDLKGITANDKDILTLYDALAILIADKRCGIKSVSTKQLSRSKSINIDPNSSDIGKGTVSVKFMASKPLPARILESKEPFELTWAAEHFTQMSVRDWLYGHPKGASNGHTGFYAQLNKAGICSNSTQTGPRIKSSKTH